MQQQNRSFSQFSQRTEALAQKFGTLLKDLPERVGISERMFYGYRSGKYPITDKAWRKLETAEREAGIFHGQSKSLGHIVQIEERIEKGEPVSEAEQDEHSNFRRQMEPLISSLIQEAFHTADFPSVSVKKLEALAKQAGRFPFSAADAQKPIMVLYAELKQTLSKKGEKP